MLRTPSEPGVQVKKELYKPERSYASSYIYIYFTSPHGLYVTSPNVVLVLSSMHYVMQTPLPLCATSYERHRNELVTEYINLIR